MMNTEQHKQTELAPELLIPWSIVVFKEGDQWLALALEHSCIAWADTQEEAFSTLIETMTWQVEADRNYGQKPFSLVPRAKDRYWALYRSGAPSRDLQMPAPLQGEVRVASW
jgi:hypothetical protein